MQNLLSRNWYSQVKSLENYKILTFIDQLFKQINKQHAIIKYFFDDGSG